MKTAPQKNEMLPSDNSTNFSQNKGTDFSERTDNSQQLYSAEEIFSLYDSYSFITEFIKEKTSIKKRLRTGDTFSIDGVPYELIQLMQNRYGIRETITKIEFSEVEFAAKINNCNVNDVLSLIVQKNKIGVLEANIADKPEQLELNIDQTKVNMGDIALSYIAQNLSVIPMKPDKICPYTWKEFQKTPPTVKQVETMFNPKTWGIAIIGGEVSGGIECIDLDCKYDLTGKLSEEVKKMIDIIVPGVYERLVIETTMSGGSHLFYRCENFAGNQKLASRYTTVEETIKNPGEKQKTLIETRGDGGYFVCAPSPGYVLIQGSFNQIPLITDSERNGIIFACMTFNETFPPSDEPRNKKPFTTSGLSTFQDYNERGDCISLLESRGWIIVNDNSEKIILKRPGETKAKHSAYFNKAKNWFSVFSTSTEFEIQKAYLPYAVYAMLECNGNFSEASKKLYELGYGDRRTDNTAENEDAEELLNEEMMGTPMIPDEVFSSLPDLLTKGCIAFPDKRERDVFLTGAITVLSGCFPNISGTYDGRTVNANLNCFIIAPPACGKGSFISAKDMGMSYHRKLVKASRDAKKAYQKDLLEYHNEKRLNKGKSNALPPTEPMFRVLFIPANSSSASVIQSLESCEGMGIICETEADTLSGALKQDWGGFSDMIRKAFHHESITYKRKTNNEYIEIPHPQLTTALTGTLNQVLGLIPNANDGLFSRFIFYVFNSQSKWRDVSPYSGRVNLTNHFAQLSEEVKKMIEKIELNKVNFQLTKKQWDELNGQFSKWLDEISTFVSEDAGSTVKRLSLIVFRIAMVLTILRKCENEFANKEITCSDIDFQNAMKLADVYRQHAILMYRNLPKEKGFKLNSGREKLFKALPDEFTRQEAVGIGGSLKMQPSTVDKHLKKLLGKFIEQTEYGKYKKI